MYNSWRALLEMLMGFLGNLLSLGMITCSGVIKPAGKGLRFC